MGWIVIKEPRTNWILARYDPEREILEFQHRRVKTLVDLRTVREQQEQERHLTYVGNKAYNVVEGERAS